MTVLLTWQLLPIGVAAIPVVCLLLGFVVCCNETSAWRVVEGDRWYKTIIALMFLGGVVAIVLAMIAGVTAAVKFALNLVWDGDWTCLLAFAISLIGVIGGIIYTVEIRGVGVAESPNKIGEEEDAESSKD